MTNEKNLREYIMQIRDELKNFAEDRTLPMDVRVHKWLWHEIESIDYYLDTKI